MAAKPRRDRKRAVQARRAIVAKDWECQRCSTRPIGRDLENSVIFTNDGVPGSLVCAGCLTVEEIADSIILEVTREVGITPDGVIMSRPKVSMFCERN